MLLTKVNRRRSTAIRSVSLFRASCDRSRAFLRLCLTLNYFYLPLLKVYVGWNHAYDHTQLVVIYRAFEGLLVRLNIWKLTVFNVRINWWAIFWAKRIFILVFLRTSEGCHVESRQILLILLSLSLYIYIYIYIYILLLLIYLNFSNSENWLNFLNFIKYFAKI